jgi:hypothetical protein
MPQFLSLFVVSLWDPHLGLSNSLGVHQISIIIAIKHVLTKYHMGSNSLKCTKFLSQHHPFKYFLPSFLKPCKNIFMNDYDGI